jgi:hypothetical protein
MATAAAAAHGHMTIYATTDTLKNDIFCRGRRAIAHRTDNKIEKDK